ncbi:MAG: aminoacyl-tRNA hydrolase [Candidatus Omnitrophota bacterium]
MKLIVGLGNPGRLYAASRHNIGFRVVKALARNYKVELRKAASVLSISGQTRIGNQVLVLAMPFTFMNLSGSAVKGLLKKYRLGPGNLLVVCDDLDLDLGRIKIRPKGSSGGHRGIRSIIDSLQNQDFSRLRLGIGRPKGAIDTAGYVLSAFTAREKEGVARMVEKALDCCLAWANQGIHETMNTFNKRSKNA